MRCNAGYRAHGRVITVRPIDTKKAVVPTVLVLKRPLIKAPAVEQAQLDPYIAGRSLDGGSSEKKNPWWKNKHYRSDKSKGFNLR